MGKLKEVFRNFLKGEEGITALEYGLIAGLIFLAIVLALTNLSTEVSETYNRINDEISNAVD